MATTGDPQDVGGGGANRLPPLKLFRVGKKNREFFLGWWLWYIGFLGLATIALLILVLGLVITIKQGASLSK